MLRTKSTHAAACATLTLAVGLGWSGCSGNPDPAGQPPLRSEMYAHFSGALEMRDGALFADLDAIRQAGRDLVEAESIAGLPTGSETFLEDLRTNAAAAAGATTLAEGVDAAAAVANSCGACHQVYEVGPQFVLGGVPSETSLQTHMAGQAWVSRLMWDGLIAPSDELWDIGAQELTTSPAFPSDMPPEVADPAMLRAAQDRLRALGEDARMAPEADAKSEVLGEVWMVCAGCHEQAGVQAMNSGG